MRIELQRVLGDPYRALRRMFELNELEYYYYYNLK